MIRYIKNNEIKFPEEIILVIDGEEIVNPTHQQLISDGWIIYNYNNYDINFQRNKLLTLLNVHDKSLAVNSFYIGDQAAWIDRETRVSLMNSTTIIKNAGQENTTLWLNNIPYVINCELLIQMLGMLEIYALQCYNVTEQHKANINNLTSIEEIQNYDFKLNYPEKLIFNL